MTAHEQRCIDVWAELILNGLGGLGLADVRDCTEDQLDDLSGWMDAVVMYRYERTAGRAGHPPPMPEWFIKERTAAVQGKGPAS